MAAGCVVVGLILLFVFRHRTSLSGCGSREVMEAVGLVKPEVDPALEKSTIFGDLPAEEESGETDGKQEDGAGQEEEKGPEAVEEPVEAGKGESAEDEGEEEAKEELEKEEGPVGKGKKKEKKGRKKDK